MQRIVLLAGISLSMLALQACDDRVKVLENGNLTLPMSEPFKIKDETGVEIELVQGPTEVKLEKDQLVIHNNVRTATVKVPKELLKDKDLRNLVLPAASIDQPVTLTSQLVSSTPSDQSTTSRIRCKDEIYMGYQYDPRCITNRARVWRCEWGTREVYYPATSTKEVYKVTFDRATDNKTVGVLEAQRYIFDRGAARYGTCETGPSSGWSICDYRCVPPPRPPRVVVVDRPVVIPNRPVVIVPGGGPRGPRNRGPGPGPGANRPDRDRPGRPGPGGPGGRRPEGPRPGPGRGRPMPPPAEAPNAMEQAPATTADQSPELE